MNNLLDFEQYKLNLRLMEQQVIKNELDKKVNEGLVTKWRKLKSTMFVNRALKEEIRLGKEFEERVRETMEELQKACDSLKGKSKQGSEFTQKVNDIIDDINKISFDTLSLLGDQNINFSGFTGSVIMSNVVQWGVIFSPIRNIMMMRKAFQYFMGLIKQTIRKDLIMLIVNFDQFQNIILQKSIEASSNAQNVADIVRAEEETNNIWEKVMSKEVNSKDFEVFKKKVELEKKSKEQLKKLGDSYNQYLNVYENTYKSTAEALKQLMNDDNQKQLDALKNSISKLSQGDEDLTVYGEMLLSAAEEKALKTSLKIHDNFLKMSEVFKLSNQKKLIDLISEAEKKEQERIDKEYKKAKKLFKLESKKELVKFIEERFKEIDKDDYLKKLTLEDIEELKDEDVEFSYEDTTRDISKWSIIEQYLGQHTDKLKDCSDDIRMLIHVDEDDKDNYKHTYFAYVDVLSNVVEKSLIRKNNSDDQCYIDFLTLRNLIDIENVFDLFESGEEIEKDKLKYINDNVVDFSYKSLMEKIHDIVDNYSSDKIDELKKFFKSLPSVEDTSDYRKYIKLKDVYDRWENSYNRYSGYKDAADKKKTWKEEYDEYAKEYYKLYVDEVGDVDVDDKDKIGDVSIIKPERMEKYKPKNPLEEELKKLPRLNVKINNKDYDEWKKALKQLKEYKDNGYKRTDKK